MPPRRRLRLSLPLRAYLLAALTLLAGCGQKTVGRATSRLWIAGAPEPAFDPDGPPDPLRASLERLLTRALVEEDSTGAIVPAAAERIDVAADSLTVTFHLRRGLAYTDGSPCRSVEFRDALVAGLGRGDHATRAFLLGAVRGVSDLRPRRSVPALGIATPEGNSCGTVAFPNASDSCSFATGSVGYDGTAMVASSKVTDGCANSGTCTCTWQWWPGFFR